MSKLTPNKLLTDFLLRVGDEETEVVVIDGQNVRVSKAEAVARNLFKSAIGGLSDEFDSKTGKMVKVFIPQSIQAVKLIREYTEGRPAAATTKGDTAGKRKARRFSEGAKKRLQEQLDAHTTDTTDQAATGGAIPVRPPLLDMSKDGPTGS